MSRCTGCWGKNEIRKSPGDFSLSLFSLLKGLHDCMNERAERDGQIYGGVLFAL